MAWVLALGVSAGYLINKNRTMQGIVETAVAKYEDDAAEPATGGVTTAELRATRLDTTHHKIGAFHQDTPEEQRVVLTSKQQEMLSTMHSFESGPGSFGAISVPPGSHAF